MSEVAINYKGSSIASMDASGTKTLLTQGKYCEDDIEVVYTRPSAPSPSLQTKSKSYTPTESAQSEAVTADNGYDGLDTVNVSVAAVSSSYVGSGITRRDSTDMSASGRTITAPSGYYASNGSYQMVESQAVLTSSVDSSGLITSTLTTTGAGYRAIGTQTHTQQLTTQAAQTIYPSTSDQTINSGRYLTGNQTIKAVTTTNLSAENIKSGVIVKVGDSSDDDRVASVTGTYSGGGGTSKNAQVVQGTTRTNSSTMTAIGSELTVSKTGTYDIYYSCLRTYTSSSYTWATRLYINGTEYGTAENTTWTNNQQNTHLSNISLTAEDKLRVYGRETRGTSYYVCAPMLVIIEA